MVNHRVEASRPTGYVGIEGLLQLLGGAMTLAKRDLPPQCFEAAKEFMVLRLKHLRVLCMTSVPSGVRDGEFSHGHFAQHCNQKYSSSWNHSCIHFLQ
jgi:hypothetical protein